MVKVVYSACFGGFGLSRKAVLLGRELSGDSRWGGTIFGERYDDGSLCDFEYNSYGRDLPRTDPILIQVVEQLGKEANSDYSNLRIKNLPEGSRYRIDEYDGNERVMTPDDYDWEIA